LLKEAGHHFRQSSLFNPLSMVNTIQTSTFEIMLCPNVTQLAPYMKTSKDVGYLAKTKDLGGNGRKKKKGKEIKRM